MMCEDACQRLGQFRQPLGMAVIPLFDERGERRHTEIREIILVNKLIRLNGDLSDEVLFSKAKTFINDKDLTVRFPSLPSFHFPFHTSRESFLAHRR